MNRKSLPKRTENKRAMWLNAVQVPDCGSSVNIQKTTTLLTVVDQNVDATNHGKVPIGTGKASKVSRKVDKGSDYSEVSEPLMGADATTSDRPKDALFKCPLCAKSMLDKAKYTHKKDNHDGDLDRIFPLRCPWCKASLATRTGLRKHLANSCEGVGNLVFLMTCYFCDISCDGRQELGGHSVGCFDWEHDKSSDIRAHEEFDKELVRITRHPSTAHHVDGFFERGQVLFPDGEMGLVYVVSGSKRLKTGSMAHLHVLNSSPPVILDEALKLDTGLLSHAYGRLVSVGDYKEVDNSDLIWHTPFAGEGESLAITFEEMMIYSGSDIFLALKVELYGTDPSEDLHTQDLIKPEGRHSFKVGNVYHDQCHKVMVGALKWCILVTMGVMLTDGTVVVGPDNKVFYPNVGSTIWIRKKSLKGLYNTMARQLRSKYDAEVTLAPYSAVMPALNHYTTMPVTSFHLRAELICPVSK